MMIMAFCIFCSIIAGEEPAHVVWSDSETMAFLDISQATPGHTLVVPKAHAPGTRMTVLFRLGSTGSQGGPDLDLIGAKLGATKQG